MVDDVILERGYIKIIKVITRGKKRSYELQFFGDNTEWMTELNNITLDELTFNNNTQTYDTTEIVNSWSRTFDDGDDHVYPWISYGLYRIANQVSVEDIRPALRYRAIIERGLAKAGFTLTSNLMDGTDWKQLIHPHVGDKFRHTEAILTDKLFKASPTVQQTILGTPLGIGEIFILDDDSTGSNFDNGSNYDAPNNIYIIPIRSKYRFKLRLFVASNTSNTSRIRVSILKNGIILDSTPLVDIDPAKHILAGDVLEFSLGYYEFAIGDEIQFRVRHVETFASILIFKTTCTMEVDMSDEIHESNDFELTNVVPEINVLSLFGDVTKLFNLYWRTDNKSKRVFVEDRDNFFKDITDAIDWTDKLDMSREQELSFLIDYKKEIFFVYTVDNNDKYLIQRNLDKFFIQNPYCSYRHVLPDRFPKGITKIETEIIAATYVIADQLATSTPFHPLTSRMWDEASPIGSSPEPSYAFNPRILNFRFDTQLHPDGDELSFNFEGTEQALIPSALAVAAFGNPIGHSLSYAQNDGLVQERYLRTLGVIEDGIELTAWINLTTSDYLSFDMRDLVYFSVPDELAGYWIVDTIFDFNPLGGLTKVRFLRFHNQDKKGRKAILDEDWGGDVLDNDTTGDFPNQPTGDPMGYGGTKSATADPPENPERRSIVANNGTKNQASKNSGAIAFGQGCIASKENQNMLGSFPDEDDSKFAIGVGDSEENRATGVRSDVDGNVTFYNGGVFILNKNGERVQVTIQSGGKNRPIYLE